MDTAAKSKRAEDRTQMNVRVDLCSLDLRTPSQGGVTDNVSARGARVLTSSPWKPNDRLNVISLVGSLKSRARVIYCVPANAGLFAVGLQLYACAGTWTSPA